MHWFFVSQLVAGAGLAGLLAGHVLVIHSLLTFALLQGAAAAAISLLFRSPRWWIPIHLAFLPLVVLVSGLGIPSAWFLAAFVGLLLVYWSSFRSRVPLYLTNRDTAKAVRDLVRGEGARRVTDAGCGTGGLLRFLATECPEVRFEGTEVAPLPCLMAKIRMRNLANCRVARKSFWDDSWKETDLLYVFLSPVPMGRVWTKACAEMGSGSLLVSNSFEIPDIMPSSVVKVQDKRNTRLYLYRIPDTASP